MKQKKNKSHLIQPGEVRNPKGRPKGSRNKFAEKFVQDFLADWEKNGTIAIKKARRNDPVSYLRVAASLIPKDFNINHTNEEDLTKMLEKFDDEELETILAAISTGIEKGASKAKARAQSNSIH